MIFKRERHGCVLRRGGEQIDSWLCWGVGLPLDVRTFQCVRMGNIRIRDEGAKTSQSGVTDTRCVLDANNASIQKAF